MKLLPIVAIALGFAAPVTAQDDIPADKQANFLQVCQETAKTRGAPSQFAKPICQCMLNELKTRGNAYLVRLENNQKLQQDFANRASLSCISSLIRGQ
ncbi:hypothetical protein [Synechococcus elongatus]|uniref:Uncharacterized protein n=1 Tax=Synechococcus elongatus (strain ATCC 33912 / PCC 7942 / FACHB-805) TaxID=1140 RepID=Q31NL2_SYNE7|nr:hypothetical protein [Synechococcus elongatus]ABB57357.1 hypothetical protein Synpcc7942_1327 [Synechococcus elongatus PCC 7942 = FACHB-805]AJD58898.1 hypothetical protein M744_09985 [Synechococcus elongatus UTEX 2973]MBD2587764.1 hypothetical protein [Synechococcus elongatus FACHB-242]MBD2688457.1 hypothetical protein [Synechococcus elongatus FACHB-1061]MBD2707528.1 hypothetical protein [Synechococcus elongatus PCC 7942 = FACHB-805]